MSNIEFLPATETVKAVFKEIEAGTAFNKDQVEQARMLAAQMEQLSDILKMAGFDGDANRVKAMAQVTMVDMQEYLHNKIDKLPEEIAVATSWTSDYLGFDLDVRDEEEIEKVEKAFANTEVVITPPAFEIGLALACYVSTIEATGRQNQADLIQSMLNRVGTVGYSDTLYEVVTSRNQYAPISAALYNAGKDINWLLKYGSMALSSEKLMKALAAANPFDALDMIFGTNKVAACRILYDDFKNNGTLSQEAAAFVGGRTEYMTANTPAELDDVVWRNEPGACRFGNNSDLPAFTYAQVLAKQGAA